MRVYLKSDRSSNSSYILDYFSGAFAELRKEFSTLSCLTLCPTFRPPVWGDSGRTGPFFLSIYIGKFIHLCREC